MNWKVAGVLALSLTGCRTVYYSAWEKLGKEKRDLLVDNVEEVRDDQKKTAEQFKDALTRLQEAYGKQGTKLEKAYDGLRSDYERSESRANGLKERIQNADRIASDLFKEWERENAAYQSAELRRKSDSKLRATRQRYQTLSSAMGASGARMDKVLGQLHDYVTFLKHNLNAQAVGSIEAETKDIERGVSQLIAQMEGSVQQADQFLKSIRDGE